MKWTIIVVVAGLVAVGANLEEDHKEETSSLPILRIKQLGEDAAIVPAPEKESKSSEETALTESSSQEENSPVEEESTGNELKRVKKSPGLTTICVEIKPSSPYEPPYFMCRGTDNEHGSYGGGYKPASYGGKPYSGKGGPYGYEKPSHGHGSHEDYTAPPSGGYGKPKPEKYTHGGSSGTYGGINAYGRPIKYQSPHSSAPSGPKPAAPYGGGYEGPHAPAGYGKPSGHYGPEYVKPYGGEGYHAGPSYHPAAPGPSAYGSGGHGPGYSSGGSYGHGPAYKGGSKPSGYDYGKPAEKYHGPSKGSGGYSPPQTGYRTIIMDGDDDNDEEINEVEQVPMEPQVGMPMPYNPQPAYPMPAAQVHSYPSPAPKVPCGTNLLVGCSPSVQPVPCYGSPAAQPPSIVYNIQPAPPMYAPPPPPAAPAYRPAPPVYKPAPPAYPQQRTLTEEMQPKVEDQQNLQKDIQDIQNTQSRTQADTKPKTTDPEMRFQQGGLDTAPQQDMNIVKDDKMRQSTDGSQGTKDPKQPTSNQFKQHQGILRQMEDAAGKMPAAEGAEDMKMSDGDDAERAKIDAMMRMTQMQQMQQMQQMAQSMGAPRMVTDGSSAKMTFY